MGLSEWVSEELVELRWKELIKEIMTSVIKGLKLDYSDENCVWFFNTCLIGLLFWSVPTRTGALAAQGSMDKGQMMAALKERMNLTDPLPDEPHFATNDET
ncbi:hypothetical protein ElyMa_000848600 [Elysia marginata]|uniref:Uncharacterized protein n=1 Tax=Elysia marginata TaxID=1093978 RepID=A0AAV4H197_9GAST|nr:hypothetical protein ElyMa_000848600 [Elysia marginata]